MFGRYCVVLLTLACAGGASSAQVPGAPPARQGDASALETLPVQGGVHMLASPAANIAVQTGPDGVLLVNTGREADAAEIAAAVRALAAAPLHTVISTSGDPDRTGATGALVKLLGGGPQSVRVIAHENVLTRLLARGSTTRLSLNPVIALPVTSTYFTPSRDFFFNGEAVFLHHVPNAHSDGDTLVHFRGSDVIGAGDVFTPDLYPVIDVASGGSVNGTIAALNRILELTVPARNQEGGTYVIPGRGRLADEADVVEYRDMVTIVRDRVQDLIAKGLSMEQVKAARPSRDYDTEYGAATGVWTTSMFVEAVYQTLQPAASSRPEGDRSR